MKRLYLLVSLLIPFTICAQNNQKQAFDDFLKQAQSEFASYEKQINYEFAESLRNQWEEFQVFKGEDVPVRPKPPVAPTALPDTTSVSQVIMATPAPVENSLLGTALRLWGKWLAWKAKYKERKAAENGGTQNNEAVRKLTIDAETEPSAPKPLKTMLKFYNIPISIEIPASYTDYDMQGNDESHVADFWKFLTSTDFEPVMEEIAGYAEKMGLKGWGLFKFIENLSDNIYTTDKEDEGEVFTVFLANQLGLDVKIGRANNKLVSMIAIAQKVYEWLSIKTGDKRYYFRYDDENLTSLYTYRVDFNEPVAQIDLLKSAPDLLSPPAKLDVRRFRSKAFGCDICIPLDTNLCQFYNDFPTVRSDIPAMTDVNDRVAQALYDTLRPKVQHLTQFDAINLLLSFMQHDFKYATDQEQFGYEKPFFCEEDFMYPYNDCEDRSILFSYLVRHIMKMEVVLLDYPNHIMTAVCFDEDIDGAYVEFEGKRFFACDPTCLNADAGYLHPTYQGVPCTILKI